MTFELKMALDILNGQIDRGIEFPEAITYGRLRQRSSVENVPRISR